jgi:hypothetical protein
VKLFNGRRWRWRVCERSSGYGDAELASLLFCILCSVLFCSVLFCSL